jgi:peptide-methionine (S)-S-oxide reductase
MWQSLPVVVLGCQELIRKLNGVVSTEVGYTGGRNDNPTYQHHPGHAEAVKVVYSRIN